MINYKNKASEYYFNMKKNEKINFLEKSVNMFREEAIKLAKSLDVCKEGAAKLSY